MKRGDALYRQHLESRFGRAMDEAGLSEQQKAEGRKTMKE